MLLKAEAEDGIDAAFATLVRDKAGAVLVDADPFFLAKREQVLGWTKAHALPAIYSFREFAVDGGLELRNQSCECLPPSGCICRLDKQNGPEAGAILREAVPTALPWVAHPRDRCGFVDAVGTQEPRSARKQSGNGVV